eukprot:6956-Heterococcus_DN1.PRE.1
MSRSSTHVLAYLMRHEGMSLFTALQFVQAKRAYASPNSGFLSALAGLELDLHMNASLDSRALLNYEDDRFISAALLRCTLRAQSVESKTASTV